MKKSNPCDNNIISCQRPHASLLRYKTILPKIYPCDSKAKIRRVELSFFDIKDRVITDIMKCAQQERSTTAKNFIEISYFFFWVGLLFLFNT